LWTALKDLREEFDEVDPVAVAVKDEWELKAESCKNLFAERRERFNEKQWNEMKDKRRATKKSLGRDAPTCKRVFKLTVSDLCKKRECKKDAFYFVRILIIIQRMIIPYLLSERPRGNEYGWIILDKAMSTFREKARMAYLWKTKQSIQ
jgi:hypothetical protein